jgi:hypothetical protein
MLLVATPDRIHFGNMVVDGVEPVWNNADSTSSGISCRQNPPVICQSCSIYKGYFDDGRHHKMGMYSCPHETELTL